MKHPQPSANNLEWPSIARHLGIPQRILQILLLLLVLICGSGKANAGTLVWGDVDMQQEIYDAYEKLADSLPDDICVYVQHGKDPGKPSLAWNTMLRRINDLFPIRKFIVISCLGGPEDLMPTAEELCKVSGIPCVGLNPGLGRGAMFTALKVDGIYAVVIGAVKTIPSLQDCLVQYNKVSNSGGTKVTMTPMPLPISWLPKGMLMGLAKVLCSYPNGTADYQVHNEHWGLMDGTAQVLGRNSWLSESCSYGKRVYGPIFTPVAGPAVITGMGEFLSQTFQTMGMDSKMASWIAFGGSGLGTAYELYITVGGPASGISFSQFLARSSGVMFNLSANYATVAGRTLVTAGANAAGVGQNMALGGYSMLCSAASNTAGAVTGMTVSTGMVAAGTVVCVAWAGAGIYQMYAHSPERGYAPQDGYASWGWDGYVSTFDDFYVSPFRDAITYSYKWF